MKIPTISFALNWLARVAGLDRAVLWGLSGKILAGLAGPVTAILIAYNFSPELQGYHYVFFSLLALQLFVELGLSGVITTFASHEWGKLTLNKYGGIEGDSDALSRLSSLAAFGFRWFGVAAAIFVFLLVVGGYAFLSAAPPTDPQVHWQGPWIGLCIVMGISVMLVPAWAILQGCGQIEHIYFYRFIETALRVLVIWVALLTGAGLWAGVIATFIALLWALGFLWGKYRHFFASLRYVIGSESVNWQRDILPLQWRIALSRMSGYFMFFLFTPALFYFHGPVVAGQFGMTWAFIRGVSGLAGIWLQAKVPEFGALVAQSQFQELEQLVRKSAMISLFTASLGGALLLGLITGLDYYQPELRGRLLPMLPIIIFMAAEVLHQISLAQSSYLRAFKRDPFLILSVVIGCTVGISTVMSAKFFGVTGMSVVYFAAVLIALVWGSLIFVRCRREWTGRALTIRILLHLLIRLLLIAVGFFPALILRLLNVRVLSVCVGRIGHLVVEPDCYLKEERLGLHPRYKAVICAPRGKVANPRMLDYWRPHFCVIDAPWACRAVELLALNKCLQFDIYDYMFVSDTARSCGKIQKQWAARPPLLTIKPDDIVRGEQRLLELGIPPGAWFVCAHARADGYSPTDELAHFNRNCDIDTYHLAMEAIVARGGWCVRVGDPSMKKMTPMTNVVDYAHHPLRADWMDLFLCARCRFFLGSASGINEMASVFGVPMVAANYMALSTVLPVGKNGVGIPKLLWSTKEQRLLTFPEILASPLGKRQIAHEDWAGLEVIENTPEDILGLALEQLEIMEGQSAYTAIDQDLQARFMALMKPGHFCYGWESRVGRDFLRKHAALLNDSTPKDFL